jgi:hypothetical protein
MWDGVLTDQRGGLEEARDGGASGDPLCSADLIGMTERRDVAVGSRGEVKPAPCVMGTASVTNPSMHVAGMT